MHCLGGRAPWNILRILRGSSSPQYYERHPSSMV